MNLCRNLEVMLSGWSSGSDCRKPRAKYENYYLYALLRPHIYLLVSLVHDATDAK